MDKLSNIDRVSDFYTDIASRDGNADSISKDDLELVGGDIDSTSQETRDAALWLTEKKALYKKLDINNDQGLASAELAEYLLPLEEQQLKNLFDDNPDAQNALNGLLNSAEYKKLSKEEQLAMLSQVSNFPDTEVIKNLTLLNGKEWFQQMDLADKQRTALAISYMTADPDSSKEIVGNTLANILGNDSFAEIAWDSLGVSGPTGLVNPDRPNTIVLNKDLMAAAGNYGIDDDQHDMAGELFTGAIASNMSHIVNNDFQTLAASEPGSAMEDLFEVELRAWRVGFEADNGRPPTNSEVAEKVKSMLGLIDGVPGDPLFASVFEQDPGFQQQMLDLLTEIYNRGPLTLEELIHTAPNNEPGKSEDLGPANDTDPNNLTNKSTQDDQQ